MKVTGDMHTRSEHSLICQKSCCSLCCSLSVRKRYLAANFPEMPSELEFLLKTCGHVYLLQKLFVMLHGMPSELCLAWFEPDFPAYPDTQALLGYVNQLCLHRLFDGSIQLILQGRYALVDFAH